MGLFEQRRCPLSDCVHVQLVYSCLQYCLWCHFRCHYHHYYYNPITPSMGITITCKHGGSCARITHPCVSICVDVFSLCWRCCRRSADGKVLWIRFEYDAVVIHSLSMGIFGSLWFDLFSGVCSLSSWCFRLLWWSESYHQASQCLGRHVLNEERRASSWSVRIKCHPAF